MRPAGGFSCLLYSRDQLLHIILYNYFYLYVLCKLATSICSFPKWMSDNLQSRLFIVVLLVAAVVRFFSEAFDEDQKNSWPWVKPKSNFVCHYLYFSIFKKQLTFLVNNFTLLFLAVKKFDLTQKVNFCSTFWFLVSWKKLLLYWTSILSLQYAITINNIPMLIVTSISFCFTFLDD